MLPDRVLNPGPLTYESDALLTALRDPGYSTELKSLSDNKIKVVYNIVNTF